LGSAAQKRSLKKPRTGDQTGQDIIQQSRRYTQNNTNDFGALTPNILRVDKALPTTGFAGAVERDKRWSAPSLDSVFYELSRAGSLKGVEDLKQGLGIRVSPCTIRRELGCISALPQTLAGDAGVDAAYRITSQMAAVVTGNIDFAETEVNSRQLNVTRFTLFFPKRRSLFQEGANQYVFGLGLEDQFKPFFCRTVALYKEQRSR